MTRAPRRLSAEMVGIRARPGEVSRSMASFWKWPSKTTLAITTAPGVLTISIFNSTAIPLPLSTTDQQPGSLPPAPVEISPPSSTQIPSLYVSVASTLLPSLSTSLSSTTFVPTAGTTLFSTLTTSIESTHSPDPSIYTVITYLESPEKDHQPGLRSAATGGIAAAATLIAVAIIAGLAWLHMRRRQKNRTSDQGRRGIEVKDNGKPELCTDGQVLEIPGDDPSTATTSPRLSELDSICAISELGSGEVKQGRWSSTRTSNSVSPPLPQVSEDEAG